MNEKTQQDNKALIDFWDKVQTLSDEDRAQARESEVGPDDWKTFAPSEKIFNAACLLGKQQKVLDYGCGIGWAAITAAKSGCPDVTAVDVSAGPVDTTRFYADLLGLQDQLHTACVSTDWLHSVPSGTYDGFICSNVLDVVPPEIAEDILRESARVTTPDALVIIGMNFYMSPERAAEKGEELVNGNMVYEDGVLRLVSRSDEEWAQIFSPWYSVEKLDHFAWPGESAERRRLFILRRKSL